MASPAPTLFATAPTSRDSDELVTGEAVALSVRPAGFLLRALSGVIDFAASVVVLLCVEIPLAVFGEGLDQAISTALTVVALVLGVLVFPIVMEVATHGRSLGRLAVGARIVRDDGGAAGVRHAFIRALSGVVEVFSTLGGLAVIVALLNPRSKRIGDLLAGTYAQHERMPRLRPSAIALPPALIGWAQVADVAALPDPLARRISSFLEHQAKLSPAARHGLSTQLAREASAFVHPLPNVDPVTLLHAVSAVRREREFRALDAEARRLAALTPTLARRPNGFPER